MATDYKEKIRKLLALSESSNEYEARAALLKARELMAEHKLMESELKDVDKQTVEKVLTDVTCSKRRNPWLVSLSVTIGENYCCMAYRSRVRGKQTSTIGFIGLEDDVGICTEIFEYAADCAFSGIENIRKEKKGMHGGYVTRLCHSYGYGFADGVDAAFQKQKKEKEQSWDLVMVIPKEVEDFADAVGYTAFKSHAEDCIYHSGYARGREAGEAFNPAKRLAETGKNDMENLADEIERRRT